MITAKQAQTKTKLAIARKALEDVITSYDENILNGDNVSAIYTTDDLGKSLNRYFPGLKYTKGSNEALTLDEIVEVCVMAAFTNAQRISELNHRNMGFKFNEILGRTVFEKVVE